MSEDNNTNTPTPAAQKATQASSVIKKATVKEISSAQEEDSSSDKKQRFFPKWKDLSYTTRMTMAFAFIAAMTVLVAVGILSFVWEQHFQTYTRENIQITADASAARLASVIEREGGWDSNVVQEAKNISDSYSALGIVVVDENGVVWYDSSAVLNSSETSGISLVPKELTQTAVSKINVNGTSYGTVRLWVYGSSTFLRESDISFRDNSYQAMAIASLIAIVLASVFGYFFARALVRPINKMARTAKAIESGDLSARTGLTGEDEISQLGETFDSMADAVEKDRALERRLTTDVAHELRTPLMAIQATVEAMVDGVFEPDEDRLTTVNSEVQRLSRLVDALLKLSRLENRSNPMKEEILDVGKVVESIVSTHEAFILDSGLSLEYELKKGVMVKGDADMIRQATANLVSNAVRYTPEGGTITLKVTQGELMANIIVQDTGIGLSQEEAKMVFSRFWRADSGRNRESGGLGIGLAVVKEIVDRHHGWVQVEGKKGEGSRFTIHIPLYKASNQKAQKDKKKKAPKK